MSGESSALTLPRRRSWSERPVLGSDVFGKLKALDQDRARDWRKGPKDACPWATESPHLDIQWPHQAWLKLLNLGSQGKCSLWR